MAKYAVARRYAEALVEAASGAGLLDDVETQLRMVVETVNSDAKLGQLFEDPKVLEEQKKAVLDKLFAKQVHPYLLNTLKLLIDKKRTDHLKDILDLYVQLANDARGIAVAIVTTATELDGDERDNLTAKLARLTGKQIRLEVRVDPGLIGGAKVRIGDTVIDASLDSRLSALEKSLSQLRFNVGSSDDTD